MHAYYTDHPDDNMQYSYINFAYGQVYFQGWFRLVSKNPIIKQVMELASDPNLQMATFGMLYLLVVLRIYVYLSFLADYIQISVLIDLLTLMLLNV